MNTLRNEKLLYEYIEKHIGTCKHLKTMVSFNAKANAKIKEVAKQKSL